MRAFKSTLEDIEEKRSIHSFHSFHSLRSSRSHQPGLPRPLCDELTLGEPHRLIPRLITSGGGGGAGGEQNGSYVNMAMSMSHDNTRGQQKTRSLENIAEMTVPTVVIQGASPSPSRTFSDSDMDSAVKLHETSI